MVLQTTTKTTTTTTQHDVINNNNNNTNVLHCMYITEVKVHDKLKEAVQMSPVVDCITVTHRNPVLVWCVYLSQSLEQLCEMINVYSMNCVH